jgi:hypothetical protein
MTKKKEYFKPILISHGDIKKITQNEGFDGSDLITGSQ